MKMIIFATYDDKAGTFSMPLSFNATGLCIRWFQEMCNDDKTMIGKQPGDFKLFQIGSFDADTGELSSLDKPLFIGNAVDYVTREVQNEFPQAVSEK